MVLKLNLYADFNYKGDPNLIPFIKSGIESHLIAMLKDGDFGTLNYAQVLPTELDSEIGEEHIEDDLNLRWLSLPEVSLLQQRLIREQQNRLNSRNQKNSSTTKQLPQTVEAPKVSKTPRKKKVN